jgi:GNAT superfamily N-acetyltransferase
LEIWMEGDPERPVGAAEVLVRRATPGDARAIAEVVVAGWQAAYRGLMPDDFLDSLSVAGREAVWAEVLTRDADGGAPAWLALIDGRAVGFVSSGPPRDDDVPRLAAEVYAIYVVPAAWRRSVGRNLLETAADHWRDIGTDTLVLWVLEDNQPARHFYEAMGWRSDGGRQLLEVAGTRLFEIRYRRRI